jgi:hypothetical protein
MNAAFTRGLWMWGLCNGWRRHCRLTGWEASPVVFSIQRRACLLAPSAAHGVQHVILHHMLQHEAGQQCSQTATTNTCLSSELPSNSSS